MAQSYEEFSQPEHLRQPDSALHPFYQQRYAEFSSFNHSLQLFLTESGDIS
jgi:hypothetical protein